MFVLLWASINLETTCSHMRREGLCWYILSNVRKTITLSYSLFSFSISLWQGCLFDGGLCSSGQVCWDGECCHILQFQFWPLYNVSHYWKKSKIMIRLAVLPQGPWNSCVIMAQCNSISAILQSFIFYLAFMHQSCRTLFFCVYIITLVLFHCNADKSMLLYKSNTVMIVIYRFDLWLFCSC